MASTPCWPRSSTTSIDPRDFYTDKALPLFEQAHAPAACQHWSATWSAPA
jgi:hypothetical protein